MVTRPSRRRLLAGLGAASASARAGCLGGMPHDTVIAVEPASEPDTSADGVTVVHYADLPDAEQRLLDDALADGLYHACPDLPDAVSAFAARLTLDSYLERDGNYHALWVRIEDTVRASSADSPDETPDCGRL